MIDIPDLAHITKNIAVEEIGNDMILPFLFWYHTYLNSWIFQVFLKKKINKVREISLIIINIHVCAVASLVYGHFRRSFRATNRHKKQRYCNLAATETGRWQFIESKSEIASLRRRDADRSTPELILTRYIKPIVGNNWKFSLLQYLWNIIDCQ